MINKDRNKPERKLIENFWRGPKLVDNSSETNLPFRFQIDSGDSMVLLSKETA